MLSNTLKIPAAGLQTVRIIGEGMAMNRVRLMVRVNAGNGKFPWLAVEFAKNGRPIEPENATSYGLRFTHPTEGRKLIGAGKDLQAAFAAMKRKEVELLAIENGMALPGDFKKNSEMPGRKTLADAGTEYFSNLESQGKDPKTIRTYRAAVDGFVASCAKTYVDEIERQDYFDFMGWLRKQPRKARKSGNPERTYFNKVSHVAIFLKAYGKGGLLKSNEYPQFTEKPVAYLDRQEKALMYAYAQGAEERFTLDYFFLTGARDGEAADAEYTDLKDCKLTVMDKPHLNWHPKKHRLRTWRIPKALADAVELRRKTAASNLIFPNGHGKPNRHLLRIVQTIAGRIPEQKRFHVDLHTLRRTYGTELSQRGETVQTIQCILGHKNIQTTMKYLGITGFDSEEHKERIDSLAEQPKPQLIEGAA